MKESAQNDFRNTYVNLNIPLKLRNFNLIKIILGELQF